MRTVLTIAGSDTGGGAGIQADIKTFTVHGVYAMSVVTALTAQNTLGVQAICPVEEGFFRAQMESVFSDIVPDAVKIGMVYSAGQAEIIASYLKKYAVRHVVLDPVMVSTSKTALTEAEVGDALVRTLFPLASVLTPNLPETAWICEKAGITYRRSSPSDALKKDKSQEAEANFTCEERERAGEAMARRWGCAVLIKGGHAAGAADDLLCEGGRCTWIPGVRIENPNTHGTGCTLSSAIAANLARGYSVRASVLRAKEYIQGAIADRMDLGKGNGPLNHAWQYAGQKAQSGEKSDRRFAVWR